MIEYARKIASPSRFFIGGERGHAPNGSPNRTILAAADGSNKHENMVPDLVARNRNRDRAEESLCFSKRLEGHNSGVRFPKALLVPPVNPMGREMAGSDTARVSQESPADWSQATGHTNERDPIAAYRTEMLCRLLQPIRPAAWGGRPVLWPLWAGEMVHRTYVTVHLTALLMSGLRLQRDASMRFELDYRVASNLAAAIGDLVIVHDNERLPCSAVVRGITHNFVELFGPVAGNIKITTRIEPLQLAAFKRRALGLLVVALISEVLVDTFRGLTEGQIDVQLARISQSRARLSVKSSGDNQLVAVPQACPSIGHDLASLLEAEIDYGIPGFDNTIAQIDFII